MPRKLRCKATVNGYASGRHGKRCIHFRQEGSVFCASHNPKNAPALRRRMARARNLANKIRGPILPVQFPTDNGVTYPPEPLAGLLQAHVEKIARETAEEVATKFMRIALGMDA